MDNAKQDATDDRRLRCDLYAELFGVRRSQRYHRKRRDFYTTLSRVILWLAMLGGSGAVIALVAEFPREVALALSAVITGASLTAVFGEFHKKAHQHQELLDGFTDLEHVIRSSPPTHATLVEARRSRGELQKRECGIMRVLDAMCHNEEARAQGVKPSQFARVTWWQAASAHFFDLLPSRLKRLDQS